MKPKETGLVRWFRHWKAGYDSGHSDVLNLLWIIISHKKGRLKWSVFRLSGKVPGNRLKERK